MRGAQRSSTGGRGERSPMRARINPAVTRVANVVIYETIQHFAWFFRKIPPHQRSSPSATQNIGRNIAPSALGAPVPRLSGKIPFPSQSVQETDCAGRLKVRLLRKKNFTKLQNHGHLPKCFVPAGCSAKNQETGSCTILMAACGGSANYLHTAMSERKNVGHSSAAL